MRLAKNFLVAGVALIVLAAGGAYEGRSWASVPCYILIDLGTLPGDEWSEALGINEAGQVAGYSYLRIYDEFGMLISEEGTPFIYEDGTLMDLGRLNELTTGAEAINESGQVVGWAGFSFARAVLWDSGEIQDLGSLGGNHSRAEDINDAGQIVGWSHTPEGDVRAFFWEDGTMTDLGALPGLNSRAFAINNLGQVVGSNVYGFGIQGVGTLWESGTMTTLSMGVAYDINDSGQVVGSGGVLWENGSVLYLEIPPEAWHTNCYAINNLGQVVGGAFGPGALLWQDSAVHNLNNLIPPGSGWDLREAYDINDAGEIVGRAVLRVDGVPVSIRGFLLIPINADTNGDDDVDLADFAQVAGCLTGPTGGIGPGCEGDDLDRDGDIDLYDIRVLQLAFTGE